MQNVMVRKLEHLEILVVFPFIRLRIWGLLETQVQSSPMMRGLREKQRFSGIMDQKNVIITKLSEQIQDWMSCRQDYCVFG